MNGDDEISPLFSYRDKGDLTLNTQHQGAATPGV